MNLNRLFYGTLMTALMVPVLAGAWAEEKTEPAAPAVVESVPAAIPAVDEAGTVTLTAEQTALKVTDDIEEAKAQADANPEDPEAHFLLAAAYSRSPYLDKAYVEIKRTKEILKARKDFEFIDRALGEYEELVKTQSDNGLVSYRLALAYYLKGYSIEKYPHHYKYGPTGNPAEFYEKARTTMQGVVDMNPNDIWARNYLGLLSTENGKDLSKGIPHWEASLKIDDKINAGAYLLLAQAYLQQGQLQKAFSYGAKGLVAQQASGMSLPWR